MGIRTPGNIAATHPFQGCTLNHSDIFPKWLINNHKKKPTITMSWKWDWHDSNVRPPPPQGGALIQLSYNLVHLKITDWTVVHRRRQELNLPSPFGTDGLAIRCITALPRLQTFGARGIRTPGPVKINGFQDRPSTTALVSLQLK